MKKIDKPLAWLMKKKRKDSNYENRNESRDITNDFTEIKGLLREYYEQLNINISHKLDEKDKFLETNYQNLLNTHRGFK